MLDIFGQELSRGDIIVYGDTKLISGFSKFSNTKLGVISNIVAARDVIIKIPISTPVIKNTILGSTFHGPGSITQAGTGSPNRISYQTQSRRTIDKVVFYPLHDNDDVAITGTNVDRWKNGKPKMRRPVLTFSCLKISKDTLSEKWRRSYESLIREFNIC